MRKQRIISILLTVALVLSILPMTVSAKDVGDFKDVSTTNWFYDYVKEVASKEYFIGTSDSTFAPNTYMNRAMFATVLARLDGAKVDDSQSGFKDVAKNKWYTGSINWAAENKIVEGDGGGLYKPMDNITREEMCAIMDRYVNYYTAKHNVKVKEISAVPQLTDLDKVSNWAKEEGVVDHCLRYGLIEGYPDGTFRPQAYSTRAEVAAVICRLAFLIDNATPVSSGGGGSGSGGTVDKKTYYTLTLNANGGTVNGKEEISVTLESGKTYDLNNVTLVYPKVKDENGNDTGEDMIFGGWSDELNDGMLYGETATVTMDSDKTLVATWIEPNDLLLQAVTTSANQVNAAGGYISKINTAIGEVKDLEVTGTVSSVGVVANDNADPKVRQVNLIAEGKLGADVVDKLLATAVYYGNRFISDVNGENTADVLTKTEITAMVKAVAADLGINISQERTQGITDQVYNKIQTAGSSLWTNFKDESGKYYFDTAVVKGADGEIATVNTNSKSGPTTVILSGQTTAATKKEAATAAAKAIGKQMYASLKTNTTDTDKVDLTATVYVDFSDGLVDPCKPYPWTYTCNVKLTLDSDGLLLYRWDAASQTNYLTAVIKDGETKYNKTVDKLAEAKIETMVESNIETQLKSETTYNLVKNGLEDMEVTMTTTPADFAKALTVTTDSTGKTVAQNWMDTNVPKLFGYLWTQGNPVSEDGKELADVLDNSALTNAVWDIVKKDIPTEDELQEKVQTQIDKAVAASGITQDQIVKMAQDNETLKAAQKLWNTKELNVGDFTATVEKVEAFRANGSNLVKTDFSPDVTRIDDINRLLEYQYPVYIKLSYTVSGQSNFMGYWYPADENGKSIGATIEEAIYDKVDTKITEVLSGEEYAAIKTLYNSDTDVKNYIIYSALTTDAVGLTYFDNDKAQAQGPAMKKLASKDDDSVIKAAISGKLDEKIQSAIGTALNQDENKTMLTTALEISTYDKAKKQTMKDLGDTLESLAEKLPTSLTSDSYVQYLNRLIGYLPESAVITLDGVRIEKSNLNSLANASDTKAAVKAAAGILEKFDKLTLEGFEAGVSGKVEYNSKDADFMLKLKMQ